MAGITKSIRLPQELINEVEMLRGDQNFTEVVTEAVVQWLRRQRRRHEDQLIEQALTGLPPEQREAEDRLVGARRRHQQRGSFQTEQREAEDRLVGAASQSALRTLEVMDDG